MPLTSPPISPWWSPSRHADRQPFLRARSRLLSELRRFFGHEDFIEIEAACLQVSPGNETHLHAFRTDFVNDTGRTTPFYLHTSPEFACKKLLAAGEERIVSIGPAFRNRERGPLHHPEFTMIEWYRANQPYEALMQDCATILALAAQTCATQSLRYRNVTCDPFAEPERLTLVQAFARFADIDLTACLDNREHFAAAVTARGIAIAGDDTWSDLFSRALSALIEPHLGIGRATILCEYPLSEAALARPKPSDPRFAERFELYACGVELANAFGELTDPTEQRRRFMADMDEKEAIYGERYPIDEEFLAALPFLPPTSGIALGFDRLVMLAAGANHIEDVIWTPLAAGLNHT